VVQQSEPRFSRDSPLDQVLIEFRPRRWEIVPLLVAIAILVVIAARAFENASQMDFAAYYRGAQAAWANGNPWRPNNYWAGMPGALIALGPLTQLFSINQAGWLMTVLNVALAAALLAAAHLWLRHRLPLSATWLATLALVGFAPLATTIWWKQLNLLVLAIAVLAYILVRRHPWLAGVVLGVGIAIKPLAILLPLFWIVKRDTRRAGVSALASAVVTSVGGLLILLARGGTADPLTYSNQLNDRIGRPARGSLVCNPANASPTGLACRLWGPHGWTVTQLSVIAGLAVLVILALGSLRGVRGTEFAVFAWACLLSPLTGAVAWPHYEVFLVPMLLVLVATKRLELWIGAAATYALAALVWTPAMSLPAQIREWLGGASETPQEVIRWYTLAMLAWFVLVAAALTLKTSEIRRQHREGRVGAQRVSLDVGELGSRKLLRKRSGRRVRSRRIHGA
jgi:hypothetical protein